MSIQQFGSQTVKIQQFGSQTVKTKRFARQAVLADLFGAHPAEVVFVKDRSPSVRATSLTKQFYKVAVVGEKRRSANSRACWRTEASARHALAD